MIKSNGYLFKKIPGFPGKLTTMKKEKNVLFIELKKDINSIINEYIEKAGLSQSDFGFAMGYLSGRVKDHTGFEQLMFLLQAHFFAGVFYAKTTKGFVYKFVDKEERQKYTAEIKKKMEALLKPQTERPSYMG